MKKSVMLKINGDELELLIDPYRTLLDVLRNEAGLPGTKKGCDVGDCGACTVIMDNKPVCSCLVLAIEAEGSDLLTIEGLAASSGAGRKLHPLQENLLKYGGAQCGFCTPGILMQAKAMLDENPHPTEDEVRFQIAGNLCRCTGYTKIVEAILATSQDAAAEETPIASRG